MVDLEINLFCGNLSINNAMKIPWSGRQFSKIS